MSDTDSQTGGKVPLGERDAAGEPPVTLGWTRDVKRTSEGQLASGNSSLTASAIDGYVTAEGGRNTL